MTRRLLVLALVLSACGQSEPAKPKLTPDEAAARAVAVRYMRAVAAKDWATACTTRTAAERAEFARTFGSCEQALARIFKGKPVEAYRTVRARTVLIRKGIAGIHLSQAGGLGAGKLAAVRDHGEWRLKDIPNAEIP